MWYDVSKEGFQCFSQQVKMKGQTKVYYDIQTIIFASSPCRVNFYLHQVSTKK